MWICLWVMNATFALLVSRPALPPRATVGLPSQRRQKPKCGYSKNRAAEATTKWTAASPIDGLILGCTASVAAARRAGHSHAHINSRGGASIWGQTSGITKHLG